MKRAIIFLAALTACDGDIDEPWQLDHDRIIAVRASPPQIPAGAQAELDALIGRVDEAPRVEPLIDATVVEPVELRDVLSRDGDRWIVTAPADLEVDEPVPVVVQVEAAGFLATKIVWLGATEANPELAAVRVAGVDVAADDELVVAAGEDVALAIDVPDTYEVTWLTSCGTMHDHDLAEAYLRVEPDDPHDGHLAVVVRTPSGGVAWRVWPIYSPMRDSRTRGASARRARVDHDGW